VIISYVDCWNCPSYIPVAIIVGMREGEF